MDMVGKHFTLPVSHMPLRIKKRVKSFCTQHQRLLYHKQYYYYGRSEEEQESGDEQGSKNRVQSDDELESKHKEMRNMLYEAESLIRQELRAPSSYLYKYMKQRIQARHRIHQIFTLGNKLTSYINKELLKAKNNAYHQSKNSQNNNTVSPTRLERNKNIAVADSLQWKDVDVISTLSKLEDLELISGAVEDQRWEPKDGGFRQLKFLKILWCGLQCWEATSDHFPVLEDLVLSHIDIEEIPSDFVDITTLKSIKLVCCSESLISSAECIQKERQEYGDDTFVVDISRSNSKLSFAFQNS
nr:putative disease resistance RPP13-like protein 3 [Ipomoea batatas]